MISVCMATYNGEKYVRDQLESILKQLNQTDEVIVSDDGSSDDTLKIVRSINDQRIQIVHNLSNHGYTGNFYNALKHAKGEYIFLSDQDDIWVDDKVQKTMSFLDKYDFVVSDASVVDEHLNIINQSRFSIFSVKSGFMNNLLRCRYLGCCMAFRRCVLEALFPVPTYKNSFPHDLWIALIAERYFTTSLIEKPLVLYRRHASNASNGGDNSHSKRPLLTRIISRAYYFWFVCKQGKQIKKER